MGKIGEITNKNLASCLDEDIFRQLGDRTNIPFLSDKSVKGINKYIDKSNPISQLEIKDLWKNLLIDSISFLKINDTREKINGDTKKLLEASPTSFLENFEKIRMLSSYGIDELAKYFDEFIEFESVLYGSDEYYRDHVDHVIGVWAIGIGLLNSQMSNLKFSDGISFDNSIFSFQVTESQKIAKEGKIESGTELSDNSVQSENTKFFLTKGEIWAVWTIIALCHDLGYPIEKASKINSKLKKILKHFGQLNIEEFSYNFGLFNGYLVEKFLNITSSKAVPDNKTKENYGYTSVQSKYRDKISKSLEDYKHGAFSALLMFKTLTYFLETDYSYNKEALSLEDLRQFYIRKEILRAICGHTCPKLYHVDLNTLSFLLILCDELQEWGRPRFQDLKQGSITQGNIEVFIDKFSFEKDQSNEDKFIGNIEIKLKYQLSDFDLNKQKYENLVKSKFKMFHHLLRSAKDDTKRSFVFTWIIEFNKKKIYKFIFDSNTEAYDILKTPISEIKDDKEVDSDPNYLEIYDS